MVKKIKKYIHAINNFTKKSIINFMVKIHFIFPEYTTRISHYLLCKEPINLKNPRTFNEKLEWLKINYKNELIPLCADKYRVREYVRNNVGDHILNKLIGVFNTPEEIEWGILPNQYVIKCTHGAGYNIIVDNKNNLDIIKTKNTLHRWLKEKYGNKFFELHYNEIHPKIIIEKYLSSLHSTLPIDYKIYCFNGKAKIILVVTGRGEHTICYDYFDSDWNELNIGIQSQKSHKKIEKPTDINNMLLYAEKLSTPFPFVRVDFYEINGKCIFGELTFTPCGNMDKDYTDDGKHYLGSLIDISNIRVNH